VIQGGVNPDRKTEGFPAISLERTNKTGLKHKNGTLSMARLGPDTATSDFFICIGDQPSLDFGGMRNPDGQGFAALAAWCVEWKLFGRSRPRRLTSRN